MKPTAVALALLMVVVTGCTSGDGDAGGDASATPSHSETPGPSSSPTAGRSTRKPDLRGDWDELGPKGFLELRLGMSQAEARATGRLATGDRVGRCTGFYLAMYGDGSGLGAHGYFTAGRGLSVIHGQDRMHTPEGVRRGSRSSAVLDSYAHVVGSDGFMTSPVTDRASYFFIVEADAVAYFGLALAGDPCLSAWVNSRG